MLSASSYIAGQYSALSIRIRGLVEDNWHKLRQAFVFTPVHGLSYAPILLASGIGSYFALNFEPNPTLVWNMLIGSLMALLIVHQLYIDSSKFNVLRIVIFCLSLALSGLFLAQSRSVSVQEPVLQEPLTYADVSGTIESVDIMAQESVQRLILKDVVIKELTSHETPAKVRVKVRGAGGYMPGQRVSMLAGLNPPSPPVSPGAFDFQRRSYFQQIGAVGFSYRPPEVIKNVESSHFFAFWEYLRLMIAERVSANSDPHLQGVMTTFLTGEKSTIAEDDLQAMRDSGLAHLLAISGLHVGLVAGFMFFFSRLIMAGFSAFALQYPIKKYAAAIALISAFFYMFLVGASVPTQRAMIMTGIALFAIMIDRSPFSLHTVAIAALIILALYPESLVSTSFQMSFAAVTGLVWFYDVNRMRFQNLYRGAGIMRRAVLYISGIATTTLIASTATALYGLFHFQAFGVYSLFANIFAVPVMGSFVMPLAVISYLLMPFGLEALPLYLMGQGVAWILYIAHYVSSFDGAVLNIAAFSHITLILLTLGALFIMIGPMVLRVLGSVLIVCAFCLLALTPKMSQILISDDGALVGIYDPSRDNLYVSSLRAQRYVRENWARRLGTPEKHILPFSAMPGMYCDVEGCRTELFQSNIAFPISDYAMRQDCKWADILISKSYAARRCASFSIIDRSHIKRFGTSTITFSNNTSSITTDYEVRGARPWTPYSNKSVID